MNWPWKKKPPEPPPIDYEARAAEELAALESEMERLAGREHLVHPLANANTLWVRALDALCRDGRMTVRFEARPEQYFVYRPTTPSTKA